MVLEANIIIAPHVHLIISNNYGIRSYRTEGELLFEQLNRSMMRQRITRSLVIGLHNIDTPINSP